MHALTKANEDEGAELANCVLHTLTVLDKLGRSRALSSSSPSINTRDHGESWPRREEASNDMSTSFIMGSAAHGVMEMTPSGEEEIRRGPWMAAEDLLLIRHVTEHGEGRWNSLARRAGLKRTGKSCRLRWLNYLRPDVRRGNITAEEQLLILELHSRWGNRWSKIARFLPGRTDNEIKNYWRTRVQKHAKQLSCDVNSETFRDAMRRLWLPRLLHGLHPTAAPYPSPCPPPPCSAAAACYPEEQPEALSSHAWAAPALPEPAAAWPPSSASTTTEEENSALTTQLSSFTPAAVEEEGGGSRGWDDDYGMYCGDLESGGWAAAEDLLLSGDFLWDTE